MADDRRPNDLPNGIPSGHEHELGEELETALAGPAASSVAARVYRVRVVEGPNAGASLSIDGSEPSPMLVGTSPAAALRLDDHHVSRRHLGLELDGAWLRVADLGSTNGTFVDGVRMISALLRGGELVRLGASAFTVEAADGSRAAALTDRDRFGRVMGASTAMRRLYPLCERLAESDVTVVIEGETGTGKEVLAESIHEASARARGPFVVLDCTAVAPNLIESALFGHEKGAFTGATHLHHGVFEEAQGGTLLIDEIGDLEPSLQPKLLRVLERGEVRRVGGSRPMSVDVRVLAATRRNLDQEIQKGRFRDDLFYRLAIARIELPPLRQRHGDVELLSRHFWSRLKANRPFPEEVLARFEDYAWPGNVRELNNAVSRLFALGNLADDNPLPTRSTTGVGDAIDSVLAQNLPFPEARDRVLEHFEQRYITRLLEQHGGNVAEAAAASGVARRYFQMIKARALK